MNILDDSDARTPAQIFAPGKFRTLAENLTDEVLLLTEEELREKARASVADQEMRRKFWKIVEECNRTGRQPVYSEIYRDTVSPAYFWNKIAVNPYKVAWIIRPIVDYKDFCGAVFKFGLDNLRDFIVSTKVTEKNSGQYLKVLEFFANRSVGPVVQRIESKNLNVEVSAKHLPPTGDNLDIGAKLEEARSKLLEAPRDVSPVEIEG